MCRKWLFLALIVLVTLCSGCWDISEINRRAIVIALGLDAVPNEKVKITLQVPLMQSVSAQSGVSQIPEKTFYSVSNEAESPMAALSGLQSKTGDAVFYGQLKVVIISRSLAKRGLLASTDFLRRVPTIPPHAIMLLTDGNAQDILTTEISSKEVPGITILNFFEESSKSDQSFSISEWRFVRGVNGDTEDVFLPIINFDMQEKTFIIKGMGVFHHDRLVGELSDSETRIFGILTNKTRGAAPSLPSGKSGRMSYRVTARTKTKALIDKGQPHFLVDVKLKGALVESTKAKTVLNLKEVRTLEQIAAREFKSEISKTIRHLQDLNADVLGFGELVRAMHPKEYARLNWDREFPRVPVQVKVKFNLEQLGSFR